MTAATPAQINAAMQDPEFISRVVARVPDGLTMMVNNICNADCTFCAYRFNTEPKTTMGLDVFKGWLDNRLRAGPLGTLVLTPVAGEPLADPTLFAKIAYARSVCAAKILFTTNGILLARGDTIGHIVNDGPDVLYISTPGLNAEAYERLYRSRRYLNMLDGLMKLLMYRAAVPGSRVALKLHLRLDRPLEEAMADPDMQAVKPYLDSGIVALDDVIESYDNWSGHITAEMLTGTMTLNPVPDKPVPCWRMVHDAAVLPDGKVRVCSCRYYETNDDELVVGDLNHEEFGAVMFGERHRNLLADVARGNWPKACQECTLYKPLKIKTRDMA